MAAARTGADPSPTTTDPIPAAAGTIPAAAGTIPAAAPAMIIGWRNGDTLWMIHTGTAIYLYHSKKQALHHMKPHYELYSFVISELTKHD